MDRQDALLEIGCEELPVDYIAPAVQQLLTQAISRLQTVRLDTERVETEATPRRLVLRLTGVVTAQCAERRTITGPTEEQAYLPNGKLTPAGEGFLRKAGLRPDQVQVVNGRLHAEVDVACRPAAELLPDVFSALIRELTFPKTMHWEASGARFARPVRWLVALFGDQVLPVTFADVTAGRTTRLHPLQVPATAAVGQIAQYAAILAKGGVILSQEQRRETLRTALAAAASAAGGRWVPDEELLECVAWMVEQPGVISGRIAASFLDLPREIVITTLREHQRYFAVEDARGKLLPVFLAVHDNPVADPAQMRPGCERVLTARLKDAEFFFREDLKRPLADRVPELGRVLWIKGLGSLLDKTQRLERLTAWLAKKLDAGQEANAVAAAHLAKADLITNMVQEKEFTSLQGIMGTYYALAQGVPEPVARAIREQYLPRNAEDACPVTPAGRLLALADKLDQLIGCWGAGFAPTGAKDPYAMRRAAQGVVAITLHAGYRYSLQAALLETATGFSEYRDKLTLADEVQKFIQGRMETELTKRKYPPDLIQALLGVWTDDLTAVVIKAEVITAVKSDPGFSNAIMAFSRVVNILPKGTRRDQKPDHEENAVRSDLLDAGSEKELATMVSQSRSELLALATAGDFAAIYRRLEKTVPLINRFFEDVLVMDPDEAKRANRLNLLTNCARLIWLLADFSRLVPREAR